MATSERRIDRGRERAVRIARSTGGEVRLTRRSAGVSIREAAQSVGMSETMFGRIERGRLSGVTVAQLALACSAVGLKFVARPYLDSEPVRDAAHARLLRRLHDQLPPSVGWRTEVPLPIPGDLRAWDAQCRLAGVIVAVEAEMRLDDLQALEHKVAVKRRDGAVDLVILLVAVTEGNRHRLADHRQELRGSFPLDARAVLSALRAGRPPAASGIVVL